jgi:hypothetical protein
LVLVLVAHIGIPLTVGFTFLLLAYATGPANASGCEVAAEIALDLTILSIGAVGGVFENVQLQKMFPDKSEYALASISLIVVNLFLSAIVIVLRKRIYTRQLSIAANRISAGCALFCGSLTIVCIISLIVHGYHVQAIATSK